MNEQAFAFQVKLMAKEANRRVEDADRLQGSFSSSDSGYLLRLLAFEILLKTTIRIHGSAPLKSHSYLQLFKSLPTDVQSRLISLARDRVAGSADYSNLDRLLETFAKNFVDLRYPYEKYEGLSEETYLARGADWLATGAPLSDADFVYYQEELYGLIFALMSELVSWLNGRGTSDGGTESLPNPPLNPTGAKTAPAG
jgi:hypothetical protein